MTDEFKNWYNSLSDEQRNNYELCMKYPILIPTNRWTGRRWDGYEYEFTELDLVPTGWRMMFGEQWAADVQDVINKLSEEEQDKIRILDLKEKYGVFCQYFSYYTDELRQVIDKYTQISKRTCILCGAPATHISLGWISPYCGACAEKIKYEKFASIDGWYNEKEHEISGSDNNG